VKLLRMGAMGEKPYEGEKDGATTGLGMSFQEEKGSGSEVFWRWKVFGMGMLQLSRRAMKKTGVNALGQVVGWKLSAQHTA
jgi:hypothetical protein